jgi:RNA polymerase sigma-70 factor, ECF subfamily
VSLLNSHKFPQISRASLEDPAGVSIDETAVRFEGMVNVVWLRSGVEEVAFVTGTKSCAQDLADKHSENGSNRKGDPELASSRVDVVDWRQQTLNLYDALKPKLLQFLRSLGLDRDEMDDVIQETFLRVAARLGGGETENDLRSWVYRVARNLAMDVHRVQQRRGEIVDLEFEPGEEPIDPDGSPEWAYLEGERSRRVNSELLRLTAQQYNSILLRAQGLRYREIGDVLGVSEQRAIHLVKRGLQRLTGEL